MHSRPELFDRLARAEVVAATAHDPVVAAEAIVAAAVAWGELGWERDDVLGDTPEVVDLEVVVSWPGNGISPAATTSPPRLVSARSFRKWHREHPEGIALAGRAGRVLAPRPLGAYCLAWDLPGVAPGLVTVRCAVMHHGPGLRLTEVRPIRAS